MSLRILSSILMGLETTVTTNEMHDELPFELAMEELLDPQSLETLDRIVERTMTNFQDMSYEQLKSSPLYKELEYIGQCIHQVLDGDYFSLNRIVINNDSIKVYSYFTYFGEHDGLNESAIVALSPTTAHVIYPLHLDSQIFDAVVNYDASTALNIGGALICFDKQSTVLLSFEQSEMITYYVDQALAEAQSNFE